VNSDEIKPDDIRTDYFLRFENLLIFLPPVIAYLLCIFAENQYCDVVLFDNHFIISHLQAGIFWFSILFIPYILHYVLRKTNQSNHFILFLHVVSSLMLIFSLPYIYDKLPPVKSEWKSLTLPPPNFEQWENIIQQANYLWQLFLIVQFVFIIYALTRIFKKRNLVPVYEDAGNS
jgi:hypothetical protein